MAPARMTPAEALPLLVDLRNHHRSQAMATESCTERLREIGGPRSVEESERTARLHHARAEALQLAIEAIGDAAKTPEEA